MKYKKVTASKAFLYCSMPCEQQVARYHNESVDALISEEPILLAHIYLKSKHCYQHNLKNITLTSVFLILFGSLSFLQLRDSNLSADDKKIMAGVLFLATLPFVLSIIPHTVNLLRLQKTLDNCQSWFSPKVRNPNLFFKRIEEKHDALRPDYNLSRIINEAFNESVLTIV